MIPKIFGATASDFSVNGIGALLNTISCEVMEEINGAYELNATILADDPRISYVKVGNIITAKPNMTDPVQAFVIESVEKNIDGEVTVYATHIAQHRTKLIPVSPFTATSLTNTLRLIKTNSLESNPFTFKSTKSVSTQFSFNVPKTVRQLMGGEEGSILDIYRGEYRFDNFTIELVTKRGRDSGVQIMYGKNMTDYNSGEEFGWSETITGVIPYWTDEETTVIGDIQYSSLVDKFDYHKTIVKDCSDRYEEAPTVAELNSYALSWINSKGNPSLTLSVGFDQYGLTDSQVNALKLGDTVHVLNNLYQTSYDSRIVSITFDVLAEKYTKLQIGSLTANLNDAVNSIVDTTSASSSGGGGGTIDVDSAMSSTSENAVMNRVIKSYVDTIAANKVDKVTGKGLSTNDFTNTLLTKLNGIESGAEVNVQSNWAETDSTSDAYIQNKPTINNGTLTINVNGTGVGSFSANQSTNTTANITVPTKTSELTNDSGYVSGVDHASAVNWGTVTFTSNEPGVGYATIGYSSNGSNTTSKLAKVDSSTNTISGDVLPSPTSTTKGGVTISDESDGSLAIGGYKVAPLVAPLNKISPSFLPDVDKWNGVALEKTATWAGGKYVPVLSSTSATTAGLSKVTTEPNDVGHIPVYDGDGWLYANTIDSSADGKAVANKTYVDTKVSSISVPTKTSDLTNDDGFITGITSSDVTTALGYTPYNSSNPNGYTSNVGTITGITMNGSSKGTSGVVNLGTVLTSHQDISGKLDKSGGTMTGQLKTSYRESVAMGSYGTAQTTVDGLVNEVRFSSGAMGSASINTAYTKNGTTIPTGWYNFIFSPHRSGGVNGSASGDNCNYGTLILAPMTFTGDTFIIMCSTSGAASVRRVGFTNKATYDGNGSGVTGFWNSAITTHQDGWLEREGNVVYCYIRFSAPATVTSGQQIATIPVGYRPSHVCHYTATRAWAIQATAPISVSKTNGAVAFINNAFAASANYVLCATWLTEEAFPI